MNIDAFVMYVLVLVMICGLGLAVMIWGQVRKYEMLQAAYDELIEQTRRDRRADYNAQLDLSLEKRYWKQRAQAAEAARQASRLEGTGFVEERVWTEDEIARLREQPAVLLES